MAGSGVLYCKAVTAILKDGSAPKKLKENVDTKKANRIKRGSVGGKCLYMVVL
jgi:hypothetical protein